MYFEPSTGRVLKILLGASPQDSVGFLPPSLFRLGQAAGSEKICVDRQSSLQLFIFVCATHLPQVPQV